MFDFFFKKKEETIVVTQKKIKEIEIENYILKETIGQGTFGIVKSAFHKQTNKKVAIKTDLF